MFRPFDAERTPIEGTMLLEASAGTGKTYALERIAARLIAGGRGIDEILVVTFTNRAAREMKERIRALLARRVREEGRDEGERERYRRALGGFDSAAIFTIHGFCRMVLSTWPFEASAPFSQELAADSAVEAAEARFWLAGLDESSVDLTLLGAAWREGGSAEFLIGRLAAIVKDDGVPLGARVRPSPGESAAFRALLEESSGRESPLGRAAEAVFAPDWDDSALQGVFAAGDGAKKTKTSLGKIREHMRSCRGMEGLPDITAGMFGDPAGCGVGSHFRELLFAARKAGGTPDGTSGGTPGGGGAALGRALNGLLDVLGACVDYGGEKAVSLVDRYLQCAFDDFAAEAVERRVRRVKDERGLWNFSDLIERVCAAVEADDSPLLPLLRRRFAAVLIDEFQDTDSRQWELFRRVFRTPGHVLVLIGDPKQSIYGFRGTGLQAYSAAKAAVPEDGCYRLDTNYRSRGPLVETVNRIFAPLFEVSADGGQPVGFTPVKSGRVSDRRLEWKGGRGSVSAEIAGSSAGECPLTLFRCSSEDESADFIAGEIRSLLDPEDGARWAGDGVRGPAAASDIAVLVRAAYQEEAIMERLAASGIPSLRMRGESVFDQPLAESVDTVLAFLEAPREPGRGRALLLDEFFRVPPDLLRKLEEKGALDELAEAGSGWREDFLEGAAAETLESVRAFSSRAAKWARDAGRDDAARFLSMPWTHRVIDTPNGESLLQDWRQLTEMIQEEMSGSRGVARGLGGIREWMRNPGQRGAGPGGGGAGMGGPGGAGPGMGGEDRDARRLGTDAPAVKVMTMHAAKGLEFPLVFIHAGFKGATTKRMKGPFRFDSRGTLEVDRLRREGNFDRHRAYEWEETKRLWYVGLTRAAYKVWMPLYSGDGRVTQGESVLGGGLEAGGAPGGKGAALGEAGRLGGGGAPGGVGAALGDGRRLPPHEAAGAKEAAGFRKRLGAKLLELARSAASGAGDALGEAGGLEGGGAASGAGAGLGSDWEAGGPGGAQAPPGPPLIEIRAAAVTRRPPLGSPPKPEPVPAALPEHPPGERDPSTGSYSSLIRRAADERSDSEDRDTDALFTNTSSPTSSPEIGTPIDIPLPKDRGARFGSLIHAVMDQCDFALAQNENQWMNSRSNDRLFTNIAAGFYGPEWYGKRRDSLKRLVRTALCAPLPGIGRLCDTPPEHRRSEVEFQMAVPESGRIPIEGASIAVDAGFLKGFIDLLLLNEKRWWVIDWKSNLPLAPPPRVSAETDPEDPWSPDALERLMSAHHYHFQYELYLLALCRTLSANRGGPVDWDSEIGGAAYLFLRGMREDAPAGIRSVKPPLERMRRLADIMGLRGVV